MAQRLWGMTKRRREVYIPKHDESSLSAYLQWPVTSNARGATSDDATSDDADTDLQESAADVAAGLAATRALQSDFAAEDDFDDDGIDDILQSLADSAAPPAAPPHSPTAGERSLAEAEGWHDPLLHTTGRAFENNADGILKAWKACCYADTKEKFDKLWRRLCVEFQDQPGKLRNFPISYENVVTATLQKELDNIPVAERDSVCLQTFPKSRYQKCHA